MKKKKEETKKKVKWKERMEGWWQIPRKVKEIVIKEREEERKNNWKKKTESKIRNQKKEWKEEDRFQEI